MSVSDAVSGHNDRRWTRPVRWAMPARCSQLHGAVSIKRRAGPQTLNGPRLKPYERGISSSSPSADGTLTSRSGARRYGTIGAPTKLGPSSIDFRLTVGLTLLSTR